MIELVELIKYWNGTLHHSPHISTLDWHDVCLSTLTYLNSYRVTTTMLKDLAGDAADPEAEGTKK